MMEFEVSFYVEHNYSLYIPEDKIEQIKADMEADLKRFASGEYISEMSKIAEFYNNGCDDGKETALAAYAYYRADDYGLRVKENYYEDDESSEEIRIGWDGIEPPFKY